MASPLLEAGAIDGARGILINITASNSIKLSEVNEASSIIQSAAHEDANIIFGAVQDESMGDQIKITVIATGFKAQPSAEMGERRERMLGEASLPEFVQPIKVQARPKPQRSAAPRFASEEEEDEVAPPLEKEELRAVPASVFDDEFFRSTMRSVAERESEAEAEATEREEDVALASAALYERELEEQEAAREREAEARMQAELAADRASAIERATAAERAVPSERAAVPERVTTYPPPRVTEALDQEPDELDIPAFLRRGSS